MMIVISVYSISTLRRPRFGFECVIHNMLKAVDVISRTRDARTHAVPGKVNNTLMKEIFNMNTVITRTVINTIITVYVT